jgi:hypothetical protein
VIQFSTEEWARLCAADERNFVLTIKQDIVRDRPDLVSDTQLLGRLNAAYDEAKRLGFVDDGHTVQFLYMESVDSEFYKRPAVARWLSKPGRPPEQRFNTMLDVARGKLREKQFENDKW